MILGKLVWVTLAGACAVGATAFSFMGPSRGEPCARDCGCAQCDVDCGACCGDDCDACCGDGQCGMTSAKATASCCKVVAPTADAAKAENTVAPVKAGCCATDKAAVAKSVSAQANEPCKVACGCPACAEDCRACCGDDCGACCGDGQCGMTKARKS